ncbi:MAG: response regulator transcription factor [Chloroflexi bacterium]|nr:response regulator transcription factor [Chloroflexota bacterium]
MDRIRVIIADDHTILREGVRKLLELHDDIEVVGEAADGKEAVEKSTQLTPDIVLMDIAMPGLGGLEATLEIRKLSPKTRILVLTQYDDPEYIYRFLKSGAAGYVLKKAAGTELVSAIRAVHRGEAFLYPSIAGKVIEGYLRTENPREEEVVYEKLTDREKQVLKLVAEGHSNKEIAELLTLSIKTVMGHRANIMEKLSVHNRTELVKFAIRKGLIQL